MKCVHICLIFLVIFAVGCQQQEAPLEQAVTDPGETTFLTKAIIFIYISYTIP